MNYINEIINGIQGFMFSDLFLYISLAMLFISITLIIAGLFWLRKKEGKKIGPYAVIIVGAALMINPISNLFLRFIS